MGVDSNKISNLEYSDMTAKQIKEIEDAAFRTLVSPGFTLRGLSAETLSQERDAMVAKYGAENWRRALFRAEVRSEHISWIFQRLSEGDVDFADVLAESHTYIARDDDGDKLHIFEVGGSEPPMDPEDDPE